MAVHGNQVRFGKDLKHCFLFQILDSGAQVQVRAEHENVQKIVEMKSGAGTPIPRADDTREIAAGSWWIKLLSGNRPGSIRPACAEDVNAELL